MAVKASATVTLTFVVDVSAVYRYYRLQASTASAPAKPATRPPAGWVSTEPAYTAGSTNSLYTVDLNVFSNGTFAYSEVSKSSSYEAAKAAYNKALAAGEAAEESGKTATNYMKFVDGTGLIVGDMTGETLGNNVLVDDDSVDIRHGENKAASFRSGGFDFYRKNDTTRLLYLDVNDDGESVWGSDSDLVLGVPSFGGRITLQGGILMNSQEGDIVLDTTKSQTGRHVIVKGGAHVQEGALTYDILHITGGDCNSLVKSGKYYVVNPLHGPSTLSGWLEVMQHNTDYIYQKFITYVGENYQRVMRSGIWGSWEDMSNVTDNKTLWTSNTGSYMNASQSATLTEPISAQKTGISLIWCHYVNGAAVRDRTVNSFIPKQQVIDFPGSGMTFMLASSTFGKVGTKFLYVSDDHLTGHAANIETGTRSGITYTNNYWVLMRVIGC